MLGALAVVLALGGCTGEDAGSEPAPPPDLTLSFAQWLPDEGSDRAMLRVTNDSGEPVAVTGAGLRWSGYGEFLDPQDSTLAPGQTLDLRVTLPPPRCDEGEEPVVGVVRTSAAEDAEELTENGQTFLRYLWGRRCESELVDEHVTISYADDWRLGTVRGEPAAIGSLLMERQEGQEPVAALGAGGSVLYDVELAERVVARPDIPVTRVPTHILSGNRCDEHARGQATAPFTFRITLRVADTTTRMLIPPPPRVQALATVTLDRACRQRAAIR